MSKHQLQSTDGVQLPRRTEPEEETLFERLTTNAYENILPARYLKKDEDGNLVEQPEELFERVAKNISVAEAVYTDEEVSISPRHIKPEHPRREDLISRVFDSEHERVELTEDRAKYVSYDSIIDDLPEGTKEVVKETKDEFQSMMERLQFMPNSPTLMNAGDELQQLSACFVDSPSDDMEDIHDTAKEASLIFQSGGGMGYGFWKLRPKGDTVGSTGGVASGPITFMETYDQMCKTVAQGGTRRGAQMGIMRVSHPDVIEFIHAKNKDVSLAHTLMLNDPKDPTNTSFQEALEEARGLIDDEGRVPEHLRNAVEGHLSNFNISVGVTEDFMEALDNGEEFTFTNPRTEEPHIATQETAELYETFGLGEYVEPGETLSVPAQKIWDRIIEGAHENGEPGVVFLERANNQHSFDVEEHPEHRIYATNPCVTGDTLISTSEGLRTAHELYEDGSENEIVVDSRLSKDTIQSSSRVYKTGEKRVLRLSTEEGYELRLTPEHRVMTDEGWTEAQNLTNGDTIHISNTKGGFGNESSYEEGVALGWLIGDGWTNGKNAHYKFHGDDMLYASEVAECVEEAKRGSEGNNPQKAMVSDGGKTAFKTNRLDHILEDEGLYKNKLQVPDRIMKGSEDAVKGFLRGLYSADGHVEGSAEKSVRVVLTTISKEMAKDVQRLLSNFGIKSRIYSDDKGSQILPDGKGGKKEYETETINYLVLNGASAEKFSNEIEFGHPRKQRQLEERLSEYTKGPYSEKFSATIESIEEDGVEPVFDLTEPETNSFVANGVVVHNCGEQPLEEYEACNLGHINLSTIVDENAPDWREFSQRQDGNGMHNVGLFLRSAIDMDELNHRIDKGTQFLDNVVTMSDFPIPEIEKKVRNMRKIGLGVMGLAQLYIQLGVEYGTPEANKIAKSLMTHINRRSKERSRELAESRGVFGEWDKSKYADPTEYSPWFAKQTGEDPEEWEEGFPIRNHNTTTIAPTGTTSMIANTSGGCEPIYSVAYFKNVSQDVQGDDMLVEFDDYFLQVLEANGINVEAVKKEAQEQMQNNEFDGVEGLSRVPNKIGELFVTTDELSARQHAEVQCACQQGVDSAISKTINAPNEATVEDTDEAFRYVYRNGGKGVTYYRDGTRSKQVVTTRADNKESSDEVADVGDALRQMATAVEKAGGSVEALMDELDDVDDDGEGGCPDCGSELEISEGCEKCTSCSYSACEI